MDGGNRGVDRVASMLHDADAVVVAASNGFDLADGYNQFACDREFMRAFGDFNRMFGLTSILQGLAAQWPSWRTRWAYLARLVEYGWLSYRPSFAMRALDALTREKPRFVITCNCNGRFERAGFDADGLFETEGSFARLRCSAICSDEYHDASPFVEHVLDCMAQRASRAQDASDGRGSEAQGATRGQRLAGACNFIEVPEALIPRCPHCGAPLDAAVDDTGALARTSLFQRQQARFRSFLEAYKNERILILELGMGQRNLAIKRPLMAFAEAAPNLSYVVVNREQAILPAISAERTASIEGDLGEALAALCELAGKGSAQSDGAQRLDHADGVRP